MKINIHFLALMILFVLSGCVQKDEVVVIIKPSFEYCDEYQCVWVIDSLVKGRKEIMPYNDMLYLINSKRGYLPGDSLLRLRVSGVLTTKKIEQVFTCRGTYVFYDDSIEVLKTKPLPRSHTR